MQKETEAFFPSLSLSLFQPMPNIHFLSPQFYALYTILHHFIAFYRLHFYNAECPGDLQGDCDKNYNIVQTQESTQQKSRLVFSCIQKYFNLRK